LTGHVAHILAGGGEQIHATLRGNRTVGVSAIVVVPV
jgi:hypothetical protein